MLKQTAGQNQQQAAKPPFNMVTRQNIQSITPIAYSANSRVPLLLPPVGYLARIYLNVSLNFTTAATGTYTNSNLTPNTPFDIIQLIRVYANGGTEFWNTSGYGAYLRGRIFTGGYDQRNPNTTFNSTNTATAIYSVPATYTTSTTYQINFSLELDIAWQNALVKGLVPLQDDSNRVTLEILWGNPSSFLTLGGTTPSITINSLTATPSLEYYAVPNDPSIEPDLSAAHIVLEDRQPLTGTGDFTYQAASSNTLLSVMQAFSNNSAAMVPANFTNLRLRYALSQVPYQLPPTTFLARNRRLLSNADLPDGVFLWPFTFGYGLTEFQNTRDVFDTNSQTDFAIISTVASSVTVTQPAQCLTIRDMLAPIQF